MTDAEQEDLLCHLFKVLHDDMPFCGCGDPGAADRLVIGLLAVFADRRGPGRTQRVQELIGGTDGAQQIVLAAISGADLIDHGSSVWGSWLTDRGKWVLWAVEQVGGVDGLEEKLDEVGFPHEWDSEAQAMQPCTDDCWRVPQEASA